MPKQPRLLLSQSYYHIMIRGNNRNIVFRSDKDYAYFLKLISKFKLEHPFELYHYCLMPSHVHLLVKTNKASDFSTFMKKIELAYFHHYRQEYGWVGHFWQGRFKSQPVGKDEYFIQCGKYIELNSVRAGIVERPDDYVFSSYNYYTKGVNNPILTEDILYYSFGQNQKERRTTYQEMIVDDIILGSYDKKIWGTADERYNERKKIYNHIKLK